LNYIYNTIYVLIHIKDTLRKQQIMFISRRKILDDLSEWTIQLGMTRRHSHSFFGRKVKVEKIIRHEMYNNGPVQHDHDIALFKVSLHNL